MISPSRTWPCFARRLSRRSRTMSFTLLSESLMTSVMKEDAAARMNVDQFLEISQHRKQITFNSCRVLGKGSQSGGSLIFYSMRGSIQELKDATNVPRLGLLHQNVSKARTCILTYLVSRLRFAIQSDDFNYRHLQCFIQRAD